MSLTILSLAHLLPSVYLTVIPVIWTSSSFKVRTMPCPPPLLSSSPTGQHFTQLAHAVHICKFSRNPPVSSSSHDLVTSQIPSQIFYTPPSHNTIQTENSIIRQLPVLERSLFSLSSPTTPTVKAGHLGVGGISMRQSQTVSSSSRHINILSRKLGRAKGRLIKLDLVINSLSRYPLLKGIIPFGILIIWFQSPSYPTF